MKSRMAALAKRKATTRITNPTSPNPKTSPGVQTKTFFELQPVNNVINIINKQSNLFILFF